MVHVHVHVHVYANAVPSSTQYPLHRPLTPPLWHFHDAFASLRMNAAIGQSIRDERWVRAFGTLPGGWGKGRGARGGVDADTRHTAKGGEQAGGANLPGSTITFHQS